MSVEPWALVPTPAMDEVTFKSDTVLSDVHLYTPNQRHLMVRLNGMGQPVFLSQFRLLWNQDSQTDSGVEGGDPGGTHAEKPPTVGTCSTESPPRSGHWQEGVSLQARADTTGQEWVGAQLDEDGDLDVVRRPRAASDPDAVGPPRDKVHPMILTREEDTLLGGEAQESSPHDIIQIGQRSPVTRKTELLCLAWERCSAPPPAASSTRSEALRNTRHQHPPSRARRLSRTT
ncbi:hypothetical protein MC885_020684 [Smutsia gigantea]|nr:hypothetical protein MC885_020684 [Smutsia gigantea]